VGWDDETIQVPQKKRALRSCWRTRPSRLSLSSSLLPREARGRRAGDEGAPLRRHRSRPRGASLGTRGNARRFGPFCPRDADCPHTPSPRPQRTGGEGRKNGFMVSGCAWERENSLISRGPKRNRFGAHPSLLAHLVDPVTVIPDHFPSYPNHPPPVSANGAAARCERIVKSHLSLQGSSCISTRPSLRKQCPGLEVVV
jgi:hypothetical protein